MDIPLPVLKPGSTETEVQQYADVLTEAYRLQASLVADLQKEINDRAARETELQAQIVTLNNQLAAMAAERK